MILRDLIMIEKKTLDFQSILNEETFCCKIQALFFISNICIFSFVTIHLIADNYLKNHVYGSCAVCSSNQMQLQQVCTS